MSARRLGRLVGSVLVLAALAGGSSIAGLNGSESGYDWLGGFNGPVVVDDQSADGYDWLFIPAAGAV